MSRDQRPSHAERGAGSGGEEVAPPPRPKKPYVVPEVLSEVVLEQAALACSGLKSAGGTSLKTPSLCGFVDS